MVPSEANRDFAKKSNCLMVVTETKFDQNLKSVLLMQTFKLVGLP